MKTTNLHPAQFPVGSAISRAAARALIDERRSYATLAELVVVKEPGSAPSFSDWKANANGSYTRFVDIPVGMSYEEAERICGLAPIQPKGEYRRIWFNRLEVANG